MQNINIEQFLSTHWQKSPIVIRQAFPDFVDLLDEHELAGLAMEEEFDSRIVAIEENKWQVSSGPFEEFEEHCKGAWTLLVQGIEKALPEAEDLLNQFHFLPSWRLDDLMVSYSVENAGVGPHVDQYDVFIIQGKGKRHWQVGDKKNLETLLPHPKLKQVPPFEAIIDEVLQPGDMIYIPPGFPHNGTAITPSLNYSVGFRAPTQTEIISSFSDYLIDSEVETTRYADPDVESRAFSSEIKPQEVTQFRQLSKQMIDSEQFLQWLVQFHSQNYDEDGYFPDQEHSQEAISEALNNGSLFCRQTNVRVAHLYSDKTSNLVHIGVNGSAYRYDEEHAETLILFLNSPEWRNNQKIFFNNGSLFVQIVSKLVLEGYWIINQEK